MIKEQKAITIPVLVITIIVILIITGISVNSLSGSNGIITRAKTATQAYKIEDIKEKIKLKISELNTDKIVSESRNANLDDLYDLAKNDQEIEDAYEDGENLVIIMNDYQCEIDKNLEIQSVSKYNPNKLRKVQRTVEYCSFDR